MWTMLNAFLALQLIMVLMTTYRAYRFMLMLIEITYERSPELLSFPKTFLKAFLSLELETPATPIKSSNITAKPFPTVNQFHRKST
jgi:hypothetical protein